MRPKRIRVKILLIVSIMVLVFTNVLSYALLLTKNNSWKDELTEISVNTSIVAEALSQHVYYDGDSIPRNQTLRHYSRSGRMEGECSFDEVLPGDKVVMLMSPNSCLSCAQGELAKLLELSERIGRDKLVIVADFALHTEPFLSEFLDKDGYYETDTEHLGLKGTPTQESAVVMLTQDGRVKTSFIVCPQTSNFADNFHEYLSQYFNRKK